jgi:oligoribonuclease
MKRATLLDASRSALGRHTIGEAATGRAIYDGEPVACTGMALNGDKLAWIDLEMTGLDVERDVIVEIACIVTDADLQPIDDGVQIVVRQDDATLARMDDFVRNMHNKSGLLAEIPVATHDVASAQQAVVEYLRTHISAPASTPLCGNSIGMDRRFLAKYMPDVDNFLHYRSVDVSSLKELCRRWYPAIYRKRPGKVEQHRALGDILESIEELRYYRAEMFVPPATGDDNGAASANGAAADAAPTASAEERA